MTFHRDRPHLAPPRLGARLLGWLLPDEERSETMGDFEERFQTKVRERGAAMARIWYGLQVLCLVPYLVKDHVLWSCIMFRNYLIIAWRNIKRSKVYSALNILGLAAGMAVFILIMLYVRYELSFDRYHENTRNIYRILMEHPGRSFLGNSSWVQSPDPLASVLARDLPEFLAATRIRNAPEVLLSVGDKKFLEKKFFWADPQTFSIFSFPLIRGDLATILKEPFSVLLSERAAHRFFGDADPIGRTIGCVVYNVTSELTVAGVFQDLPANSHFIMDIVAPFETLPGKMWRMSIGSRWNNDISCTYVLLKDGADPQTLEIKLNSLIDRYRGNSPNNQQGQKPRYFLQALTQIHLFSRANGELAPNGDFRFVLLLSSIAVLVLVIACVNYMNLATARSLKRAKEVGLRKVVGAAKGQLVRQFLGDSMMITFLALLLAVGTVLLVLPAFRAFFERDIVFNPLRDVALMPGLILLAAAVGIFAGSYPAFFVSAFRPVSTLKGSGASKSKGRGLRNGLIVFQFAASIALIICTVGVRSQLRFIRNRDMGYERDQILVFSPRGILQSNIGPFKTELLRNPGVRNVSASSGSPNNVDWASFPRWTGMPDGAQVKFYYLEVDDDFVDVFGIKLAAGRNFSPDFLSDAGGAFLINETAQEAMGGVDPVGRDLSDGPKSGTVVGVIKDFHMHSLHLPVMPLYLYFDARNNRDIRIINRYVFVKIREENIPATLAFIRRTWERFAPDSPFEYSFFDEIFDQAYRAEQRLGTMFSVFAGLAVLIACLGLLGLASFTAEQKTKEIGIRKVLGASTSGVIALLSREFMKWVVLANLVAWPIGYFAMRSWLRNFAYRTSLTVPMFLGAGLAAFAIAAAVICLQTYRAAAANPADSIRYE